MRGWLRHSDRLAFLQKLSLAGLADGSLYPSIVNVGFCRCLHTIVAVLFAGVASAAFTRPEKDAEGRYAAAVALGAFEVHLKSGWCGLDANRPAFV